MGFPGGIFYARLWLSGRQALPALLAELTILLRRHTNVLAKGTVEAATGAKTGGQGNVEDRLIGVAEQGAHVVDAHRGNVLLHGLLHHPLENAHGIVGVQFDMLGDGIDGQRPIVVGGDKFKHLADVKLRMP